MTGQTCFCFTVQIVDIQGLAIKRVRLELGAHTAEPFLSHDLQQSSQVVPALRAILPGSR